MTADHIKFLKIVLSLGDGEKNVVVENAKVFEQMGIRKREAELIKADLVNADLLKRVHGGCCLTVKGEQQAVTP
jgi:hypothetical protein